MKKKRVRIPLGAEVADGGDAEPLGHLLEVAVVRVREQLFLRGEVHPCTRRKTLIGQYRRW